MAKNIIGLNLKKTIICFAEDWARFPSSAQEIMSRLSVDYRILWIDSLGLRAPRLCKDDLKRIWSKLGKWFKGPESCHPNKTEDTEIMVYTPIVIPYFRYGFIRWINQWILRLELRALIKKYDFGHRILWIACPAAADMVGKLGEERSIYYCADEHAELPGMSRELVDKLEEKLLKKVDCVLVTSEALLSWKKPKNAATVYIPHGVDFDHFIKATAESTPIPDDIKVYPKPIIGYYGLIQDLIDIELIQCIAQSRPDWSVAMIGPVIFDIKSLPELPNLFFLGARPYSTLPNYLKAFDVCLIPYRNTERMRYANPLKLRQYLAAGKPVISTPVPESLRYQDVIRIGHTPEEFINQIEQALHINSTEEITRRINRVKPEAWDKILPQIEKLLSTEVLLSKQ
jgi:glycosyltransferase involved in cell wall biosynthesis